MKQCGVEIQPAAPSAHLEKRDKASLRLEMDEESVSWQGGLVSICHLSNGQW